MEDETVFINEPLDLNGLPEIEEGNFVGLHGEYLGLRLVNAGLFIALALAGGVVLYRNTDLEIWHIYVPLLLVAAFSVFVTVKGFKNKGYQLRTHDISYRTGYLFRSITMVPLVRIQHSEVTQGPLQRLFDLATVKIYTAGGQQSDLSVPGLSPDEANKLRDYINNTVREHVEG
jgi:membrane protein YdbS with pleckstrin-like domain